MQTQPWSAETSSSVEASPCGFISRVEEEKKLLGVHCLLSAEFLFWKPPEWSTVALPLWRRLAAARPRWRSSACLFIIVFIYIATPSFEKLIGFAWVMSAIDRKYKLIRKCEMFTAAMEDSERRRGWRLMERRLPSVSSAAIWFINYSLLWGGYLTLHANWQQRLKFRGGQRSISSVVCLPPLCQARCATY